MIPLMNLKRQYVDVRDDVRDAVDRVLESGVYTLGPEVDSFERAFAEYCGVNHAVAVNSGTSALHLALLAAGVGRGDEVVTSPLTFVATAAAIDYCGATPVFVDVEPDFYTLDPLKLEAAINHKTKAVIPVHLHGQAAEIRAIAEVCERRAVRLIEDAAQAHGTEYGLARAGSFGAMGCFSFYPGKNLGAYGEGGAVVTNDVNLAERVSLLRDWGSKTKYNYVAKGFNYRLESLQAAILSVKLKHLEGWTAQRIEKAEAYTTLLSQREDFILPKVRPNTRHVFHVYSIRVKRRQEFMNYMRENGVATAIHYPSPLHLLSIYSSLGYKKGDFPVSEMLAQEFVSLPICPYIDDSELLTVVGSALAFSGS